MSVINQMLKDLEQRTPEQGQAPVAAVAPQKSSTLKTVVLTVIVLLSLNALGFYIWNLEERVVYSLKQQEDKPLLSAQEQVLTKLNVQPQAEVINNQADNNQLEKQQLLIPEPKLQESKLSVQVANMQQADATSALSVKAKKNNTTRLKAPKIIETPSEPEITPFVEATPIPTPAKMSVSRRQLSSKELVSQKLAKAEKAININEITKAEQLFEEVLIIEPENKQARKKLAALWFGRKSYQQALNLLSQGIAIDKQDGELRLIKARIHINQGQKEAAYNTLKSLSAFEQEEYQVMLANIAQQIEQYSSAIGAYQVLINMQPYRGRWHLGLAITYDKNSQFSSAKKEYGLALTKADLSASSAKFAQQRMQALGE